MIEIVRDSSCEAYTRALGTGIASVLQGGDVLTLTGGLGAGKTTLTRALVAGLGGNPAQVSSPTFVVINQYDLASNPGGPSPDRGIRRIAHIDAYRLDADAELETLGWDRYFQQGRPLEDVLAIIEWPEKLGCERPLGGLDIAIETVGPTSRRISLAFPEAWKGREGMEILIQREPARCRVTGAWISPTHATYPFADARARDADLHRWFSGQYRISRDMTAQDIEGEPEP